MNLYLSQANKAASRLLLWWAERDITGTTNVVIPISYKRSDPQKPQKKPQKHPIHKAVRWKQMLDDGIVESKSEIAKADGLSPARVSQVMNLLKLPSEVKAFLAGLEDPKEIREYSERRLLSGSVSLSKE